MRDWNPTEKHDDGYVVMPIKRHSLEKYKLAKFYSDIFTKSMRNHWPNLFYIDLFCGPGLVRVDDTGDIVASPALAATNQEVRFDRYIFCDSSRENVEALRARAPRVVVETSAYFLVGNSNEIYPTVLRKMPPLSRENRGLSFCYVDPYRLVDLKFSTLHALSENKKVDFLVLIPTGMDAVRNTGKYYIREDSNVLDDFLGKPDWRTRYHAAKESGRIDEFVLNEFVDSMVKIGYKPPPRQTIHPIKSYRNNAVLYHLALFSKHDLGTRFWQQAIKFTAPQRGFDF